MYMYMYIDCEKFSRALSALLLRMRYLRAPARGRDRTVGVVLRRAG